MKRRRSAAAKDLSKRPSSHRIETRSVSAGTKHRAGYSRRVLDSPDAVNQARLVELGWNVLVIWECEVKAGDGLESFLNSTYSERAVERANSREAQSLRFASNCGAVVSLPHHGVPDVGEEMEEETS